ncbi:MAG TPA: hypothetical protein VGD22_11125 [Sphingobacteriaceae bacterium]
MYRSLLFLILLFTISCNRCNNASDKRMVDSKDSAYSDSVSADTSLIKDLPWITAIDPKTGNTQLQHLPGKKTNITPQQIIKIANKKYPQIQLQWIKQEGGTAYLRIADATYLTQSMGSAGAEAYISEITFSFTEVKGIDAINLEFTEGDHASPGVYTREQFKNLTNNK